jgi:hypothetical protein
VRPCGLRRLRGVAALRLFRDAYENCGGLLNQKRPAIPLNALLAASKPPTRLHTSRQLHAAEAVEEKQNGKKLLRLKITAEASRAEGEHTIVDRVVREYTITFGRYGRTNATV